MDVQQVAQRKAQWDEIVNGSPYCVDMHGTNAALQAGDKALRSGRRGTDCKGLAEQHAANAGSRISLICVLCLLLLLPRLMTRQCRPPLMVVALCG
mgnify:CR=1 FL=1